MRAPNAPIAEKPSRLISRKVMRAIFRAGGFISLVTAGLRIWLERPSSTGEIARIFFSQLVTCFFVGGIAYAIVARRVIRYVEELASAIGRMQVRLDESKTLLEQASKMSALGEAASGIAHEIRNPIGTIMLASDQIAEIVQGENPDRALLFERAKVISATGQRIASIVSGFKAFARNGSGSAFEVASIRMIVEDTLILCRERVKAGEISLEVSPMSWDLSLRCHAVQISQVLLNLLNNSCDAVQNLPEKWIRISVGQDGDSLLLRVTDSGSRIPDAVIARMFQPFFTTKRTGTGIGLHLSRRLIREHGGRLEIDRACPNTSFVVRLPGAPDEVEEIRDAA